MRNDESGYADVGDVFAKVWEASKFKKRIKLAEWASQFRRMSNVDSALSKWSSSLVPCSEGVMNALNSGKYRRFTLVAPTQTLKTEIILNKTLYHIDREPTGILIVFPDEKLARGFSKGRLTNAINATFGEGSQLYQSVEVDRGRGRQAQDNTIERKVTMNGTEIDIVSVLAKTSTISRPRALVFADEVDHYPDATRHLDDLYGRTQTFINGQLVQSSAPKGDHSVILAQYYKSYGFIWNLKCVNCRSFFAPEWEMVRETNAGGRLKCPCCDKLLTQNMIERGNKAGKWLHDPKTSPIEGLHIGHRCNAFASPFITLDELIAEHKIAVALFEENADDGGLQAFFNNRMTQNVAVKPIMGEGFDPSSLRKGFTGKSLPLEVDFLTCAIDTQDQRIEFEVVGWSWDLQKRWGVQYGKIAMPNSYGSPATPSDPQLWLAFKKMVWNHPYETVGGKKLGICAVMVDSGGHYTRQIMKFCHNHKNSLFIPIKGVSLERQDAQTCSPFSFNSWRRSYGKNWENKPYMINTNFLKSYLFRELAASEKKTGNWQYAKGGGYDDVFFTNLLTSEIQDIVRSRNGKVSVRWVHPDSKIRNEPVDLMVYNYAAANVIYQLLGGNISGENIKAVLKKVYRGDERFLEVDKNGEVVDDGGE
jgi:phage terminase large subunit GpA-like protein